MDVYLPGEVVNQEIIMPVQTVSSNAFNMLFPITLIWYTLRC